MKNRRLGFVAFILILTGLWLLNRADVTLTGLGNFELSPIGQTGYQLKTTLALNNPNLLSSTIKNIHQKVSVNGKVLTLFDNELNQGIPGRKETDFPITTRISKEGLLQTLGADTLPATIPFKIEGDISFNNLFGDGNIKLDTMVVVKAN